MHDCGSCQNFTRWKNDQVSTGLCEKFDFRTNTDAGHKCREWKAIPYERKNHESIHEE